jgi:hypothetical protein
VSHEIAHSAVPAQTPARRGALRTLAVGVMVTLFIILLPVTTVSAWAHRTVLDTNTYVNTLKPIAADPVVTEAMSREITDQMYAALDIPQAVAQALPPKAVVLAGPIANGARDYVQKAVERVLSSPAFQKLWTEANRFAHTQLVAVLRGHTDALQATGGAVVINLVPLLDAAMQRAQAFVSRVTGHPVVLPAITGHEVPSVACAKISAALQRPLPPTCGVITLFRAHNLTMARRLVQVFDRTVLGLLIALPVLAALALALSRRRRRTLLQLSIGGAIALVLVRRTVFWGEDQLLAGAKPENRAARGAIVHHLLNGFFGITLWLVALALLTAAIALVTGPYAWAVATRRAVSVAGRAIRVTATGNQKATGANEAVVWTREHYDLLRWGGIAVAVILIAALNLSLITFLVVAVLLGLFEVGVHRLHALPPTGAPRAGIGGAIT